MNLLLFLCLSRFSHALIRRVHVPYAEVIGDVEQLGQFNWSVISHGSIVDPFK